MARCMYICAGDGWDDQPDTLTGYLLPTIECVRGKGMVSWGSLERGGQGGSVEARLG